VQRGGAGAERQRVGRADRGRELLLERIYLRAEGCDPVRGEGLLDKGLLQAGHVRRRKINARRVQLGDSAFDISITALI
jgi:hypothetical protein